MEKSLLALFLNLVPQNTIMPSFVGNKQLVIPGNCERLGDDCGDSVFLSFFLLCLSLAEISSSCSREGGEGRKERREIHDLKRRKEQQIPILPFFFFFFSWFVSSRPSGKKRRKREEGALNQIHFTPSIFFLLRPPSLPPSSPMDAENGRN